MKTKQQQKTPQRVKLNNKVAVNPLLGKGGRHETTVKAKRTKDKVKLKKTWFERAAANTAIGSSYVVQPDECRFCR